MKVDQAKLLKVLKRIQKWETRRAWCDSHELDRVETQLENAQLALAKLLCGDRNGNLPELPVLAQAEAGAAEVWLETGHAELVSITRCVSAQMWDDLRIDLTENAPDLPEGMYTVPISTETTDLTGNPNRSWALDWDRAALAQADAADGAGGAGAGAGVGGAR